MVGKRKQRISLILAVLLSLCIASAGVAETAGDPQALYELGLEAYTKGDNETAAEYFLKASDLESDMARNALGLLYYYGAGVEQSYEKAAEFWQLSVDQGNAMAMVNLGSLYEQGKGVEQSFEKAAEYYRKAAELGDQAGMAWLGILYENGQGVEQSYEKAAEYYRKSAKLGSPAGQIMLGDLYYRGNGVEQSYETAAECYQAAIELGEPYAYFSLGNMYLNGQGVEQSAEKAVELYRSAAEQGIEEARDALRKLAAADNYGLTQTEGIVIPDCTRGIAEMSNAPRVTPAIEFVRNLKVGWNLGNTFDAYRQDDYKPDDYETFWSGAKTTRELISAIRGAGFNIFRIPVSWHNHLIDDAYTIDPVWLARVAEVASWALEEDMYVIINIHHDNDINFLYPDPLHYEQSAKYLTAIWSQVAAKFADCDEHVIFESMNEPRLVGTEHEWDPNPEVPEVRDAMLCINSLNRIFVETIRAAGGHNQSRFLIIPGYSGSCGGALADEFELPADDRIIVEVHAYTPYDYALNNRNPDSSFDLEKDSRKQDEITGFMDDLYRKYIACGVPVVIDEFGALKKKDSDLQGRVNYAAFYTAAASTRSIPVVWWDNACFSGEGEQFGLLDRNTLEWVYPDIAMAIVQNAPAGRETEH